MANDNTVSCGESPHRRQLIYDFHLDKKVYNIGGADLALSSGWKYTARAGSMRISEIKLIWKEFFEL